MGERWALREIAVHKLGASALHADSIGRIGFGIERHGFAVDDVVLTHPTFVRLTDADLDAVIFLTPAPHEFFHTPKALDVRKRSAGA